MKTKRNDRRVLNINKSEFDKIKEYCDANVLNMSKWITKIALEEIKLDFLCTENRKTLNEIKKNLATISRTILFSELNEKTLLEFEKEIKDSVEEFKKTNRLLSYDTKFEVEANTIVGQLYVRFHNYKNIIVLDFNIKPETY